MVSQFGSLDYTIMEKTADLTVVQKTIIDTLHKEWTEAGVKTSRAPHTDVSRNLATVVFRGVLPGLREEELDCCPVVQSPLFR